MDLKKNKENYEINVFHNKKSRSHYTNIVTKDPKRLALIFIDLIMMGFPVEKAFKIAKGKIRKKDWF